MATASTTEPFVELRSRLKEYLLSHATLPEPDVVDAGLDGGDGGDVEDDSKTETKTSVEDASSPVALADPDLPIPLTLINGMIAGAGDDEELTSPYRPNHIGYPAAPFYILFADRLLEWTTSKVFPLSLAPMHGYAEVLTVSEWATSDLTASVSSLIALLTTSSSVTPSSASSKEEDTVVTDLLSLLGEVGVHFLLGLRRTTGTIPLLPPPRADLLALFEKPWKPTVKLSTGARALTKHCHRSSESFWGESKGSQDVKNAWALDTVETILDNASWINCHTLPHEEFVVEMRVAEGYGARWRLTSPQIFRGFLEPFLEDGHEKGWKH